MDLFDLSIGQRLKEQGMAKAAYSSQDTTEWLCQAKEVAKMLAAKYGEITIEDVLKICPPGENVHPNSLGSIFKTGFKRIGYVQASKVSSHCRVIGVWTLKQ